MADDSVGTRKRKKKPVDVINTPEIPFYYYGTPPRCSCMGTGYCWKPCKKKKGKKTDNRKRTNKKKREPDIRTWHPDK